MIKRTMTAAAALATAATTASAGGIERTNQVVGVLFEEGRYVELSLGYVDPTVSGTAVPALGGFSSGDMAPGYWIVGGAYRQDINDKLSFALIYDQPYGANVDYPTGTNYFAQGSTAELSSNALTGLLKYQASENVSVYGGLRYQTLAANANIPFIGLYTANGAQDGGFGYVVGAAYEIPEIAFRLALTYNSEIKHDLATSETAVTPGGPVAVDSTTPVTTPQSVNVDFQTGLNENTLLFAGVRWVEWGGFNISPTLYNSITQGGSLVSFDDDTITYTLGIGRRINEKLSVSGRVSYEGPTGGFASNLGPTDGALGVTLAAQYNVGAAEISAGLSYVDIGDATTSLAGQAAGQFSGNYAIGAGLRVGYRF